MVDSKQHQGLLLVRGAASSSYSYRTHTCGELGQDDVGQTVTLCGWARKMRQFNTTDLVFLPLADASGVVQLILSWSEWREVLGSMRSESVLTATGVVQARPRKDQNTSMVTGSVEVKVESISMLGAATRVPFTPGTKGLKVSDCLRLEERHLDLRTSYMQRNLRLRSAVAMAMRDFLVRKHSFVEVETPTLFRRTSEGAREFLVPTRRRGEFYSLTQSPQQFKQLLMVGGIDRYFQFARCYRDEDLRSDRQPEFTQLDLEMSFVGSEGIMSLTEDILTATLPELCPQLQISASPFPRVTYKEALEKYGTDKPDSREDKMDSSTLNFLWVTEFPLFTWNDKTQRLRTMSLQKCLMLVYLQPRAVRVASDAIEAFVVEAEELYSKVGDKVEQMTTHGTNDNTTIRKSSQIRDNKRAFPVESTHHPFTAPVPEDEHLIQPGQEDRLEQVRGQHYDLVLNGVELGGGSIRIHQADLQERILQHMLNIPAEEFTHLLNGLRGGCPPHGGIALGFDRLMSAICQVSCMKDVIAFPKSFHGRDLLTAAPTRVSKDILKQYHIATV